MAVYGLSLHPGSLESRKPLKEKFIFQIGTIILRYKQTLFIQVIYSCFSCYHVPTSSFDERLVLETSALKLFMVANLRFQLS